MLKRLGSCRPGHVLGRDRIDQAEHNRRDQLLHVDLREKIGDIARSRSNNQKDREKAVGAVKDRGSGQESPRGLREFQRKSGLKQSVRLDFLENAGFQTNFRIPRKQETNESSITEEITAGFGKIILERSNVNKKNMKAAKQRQ